MPPSNAVQWDLMPFAKAWVVPHWQRCNVHTVASSCCIACMMHGMSYVPVMSVMFIPCLHHDEYGMHVTCMHGLPLPIMVYFMLNSAARYINASCHSNYAMCTAVCIIVAFEQPSITYTNKQPNNSLNPLSGAAGTAFMHAFMLGLSGVCMVSQGQGQKP